MKRRYAVLGLSVFLALALAVPALGGPTNPVASISASAKSIANKALKKAKQAQSTANTANSTANTALTEAKKGVSAAAAAQTTANTANTTANAAKKAAEEANANAESRIQSAVERSDSTESNTETTKSESALCEENETALGGGFFVGGASNSVTVVSNEHTLYGSGWFVSARAISGTPSWSLTTYVMCGTR
jgi:hypothetical protein